MRSASITWDVSPSDMADRLEDWKARLFEALFRLGQVFAQRIQAWAQQNATWTDRTTNARQGLTGRCIKTATGFVIWLFHTMEYGIWLEIANAGKYAVVLRALEHSYGPLMAAIKMLVGV